VPKLGILVERSNPEKDKKGNTSIDYYFSSCYRPRKKESWLAFVTTPEIEAGLKKLLNNLEFLGWKLLNKNSDFGWIRFISGPKKNEFRVERHYPKFFNEERYGFGKVKLNFFLEQKVFSDLGKVFPGHGLLVPRRPGLFLSIPAAREFVRKSAISNYRKNFPRNSSAGRRG